MLYVADVFFVGLYIRVNNEQLLGHLSRKREMCHFKGASLLLYIKLRFTHKPHYLLWIKKSGMC